MIKAGEKLRRQHSLAGKLTVFVQTNRFQTKKPQFAASQTFTLPFASNENSVLFDCAKAVLQAIFRRGEGYEYHKVGVMLSALSPDTGQQLKLFVETPDPRRGRVEKTLDRIRLKYGKELVWFADQMPGKEAPPDFLSKQQYKSEAPTTNWQQILKVA